MSRHGLGISILLAIATAIIGTYVIRSQTTGRAGEAASAVGSAATPTAAVRLTPAPSSPDSTLIRQPEIDVELPLSQAEVEVLAVSAARRQGLQGTPTDVMSKLTNFREVRAWTGQIDDSEAYFKPDMPVWLVTMRGKVIVHGPPMSDGSPSISEYDNAYVLIDSEGRDLGFGARPTGKAINLNEPAPPLREAYPAPEGGYPPKCVDSTNCP